ncbi:MAG: VOC family protein, partial [Candidatus Obscuribacterales bacterium]|nr:VOC family protein [Candidatus Obscuribacterales bacterium]
MQKISTCIWFDKNAEEAAAFYTSLFEDSHISKVAHYNDASAAASGQPKGSVMTISISLAGQDFLLLNGGPVYKPSPAISFYVGCKTENEIDELFKKLSEGGKVLMPLSKYPFSEKFAWFDDKYGVSWRLNLTTYTQKIVPSLFFVKENAGKAEEAINFYASVFPNSKVDDISRYEAGDMDKEGLIKHSFFTLCGQKFIAFDSTLPHAFNFTPGVSFIVNCDNQAELDEWWHKLNAVGEGQCGWHTDKYGVSWQLVPAELDKLISDEDPEKSKRVMEA